MEQLPTLYKRTKTGAIQYWRVEVQPDLNVVEIRKESGQLGTLSPALYVELVSEGKNIGKSNETTFYQQAELQAKSDWLRKRDEGYKSLEGLEIIPIGEGLYNYLQYSEELVGILDKALPRFNSDANGNVKPMLAKAVNWDKVTYPCCVQPKLDGVRCLMIITPEDGITYLSRSGKEYTTLDHITASVVNSGFMSDKTIILDGEIYSDELTFQEIVAAVKKQRPDSLKLKFRCYDMVSSSVQSKRWSEVFQIISDLNSEQIVAVDTVIAQSREEIEDLHRQYVLEGYEGAMIRLMDGYYGQGQRSSHLLKVKEFDTGEFTFLKFELGQRGVEDLIAVCTLKDGREFSAKMMGNKVYKQVLYNRSMYEHSIRNDQLTVKHFGWTDDGLPRFPIGVAMRDYE